ncbi:MAG: hypothetical protein ACLU6W_10005 [Lachnospiraceae bacterium]
MRQENHHWGYGGDLTKTVDSTGYVSDGILTPDLNRIRVLWTEIQQSPLRYVVPGRPEEITLVMGS